MIIMIWIQTGFAHGRAVGRDQGRARGAHRGGQGRRRHRDARSFWKITSRRSAAPSSSSSPPSIVTVMKIFDLVKATTNGNFETDVLANRMYESLRDGELHAVERRSP